MLPIPNLDDRTFEQLVREARQLIPGIFDQWTDQNEHDPGITLLEMLAWHIESQQFQLDQLTDRHERKFLKLLGEAPRDRVPATTSVSFSHAPHPILIPYGTLLRVADLPFETVRSVAVIPDIAHHVTVHTADGTRDIFDDFESGDGPFYPFGEQCEIGSSMEITFQDPLPESMPLSLWFELYRQEPPIRIPAYYKKFVPSGAIEWSYWLESETEGGRWEPVALERDESYGFQQSGPVLFHIPPSGGNVKRLKAELAAGMYNDPPRIRRLVWNEVFVKQGQTLCISECFDGRPDQHKEHVQEQGSGDLRLELRHALFQKGIVSVQIKHASGGWVDMPEPHYSMVISEGKAQLHFHHKADLPAGKQCIRVIAVDSEFADQTYCATGTGISGQSCRIPVQPMLPDQFRLQVGWKSDFHDQMLWYDWERVLDFDESDAESFHYVIDESEGLIRFSDGINGVVPPSSEIPNIRIIGYRIGIGEAGNVKEGTIKEIDVPHELHVNNLYPAYGGAEPETLKEAIQRTKLKILEPQCGVTAQDLEHLVLSIPGLRIARVKAIPGYKTSIQNYPSERAMGHTSIVIVPISKQALPKPSRGMMETIRIHLEPYRLLTTSLHIIPPEYVKVTVRAVVVIDPRYEGREHDVRHALNQWLKPFGDGSSTSGWEFGRPIYKGDVYDVIHRVSGILYIQDVWIMAEGKHVYREEGGDIRIPPNGLVTSGDHEIEFITSNR